MNFLPRGFRLGALAVLGLWCGQVLLAAETPAEKDQRMAWFREARFGMFIHWGVYAVPAGEWKGGKDHGEWIMENRPHPGL